MGELVGMSRQISGKGDANHTPSPGDHIRKPSGLPGVQHQKFQFGSSYLSDFM